MWNCSIAVLVLVGLAYFGDYVKEFVMVENQLAESIVENGITYHLAEDGCYYPQLSLEQKTDYGEGGCDGTVKEGESNRVGAESKWDKGEGVGDCKCFITKLRFAL